MTGEPEPRVDLERRSEVENDEWKHDVGQNEFGDEEGDHVVGQSGRTVRLEVRTNVLSGHSRSAREDSAGQEREVVAGVEACRRREQS